MDRLTYRDKAGNAMMAFEHEEKYTTQEWIDMLESRLADYEDTGMEPWEIGDMKTAYDENQMPYSLEATGSEAVHIMNLLLAEAQGRMVILPCKVGELVWVAKRGEKTRRILLDSASDVLWEIEHGYAIGYTKEEAEAALREQEETK